MSDLNLNFDTGNKNISLTNTTNDNLGFNKDNTSNPESPVKKIITEPNLNVADPTGMGILANNIPITSPTPSTPKSEDKKEEFTFFKPAEDKGGIINGDLPSLKKDDDKKGDSIFMSNETKNTSGFKSIHQLTPQEIKNEKIDLIYKFKKLESQGIRTTMNYNMNSHLEDMRNEFIKLKKQRENDNSIKFQRKMLMACVTGLEFLNNRFDPFSVKLDGWSENINENLNDYDEIFEELADKYGGDSEMAPEIRLLFTLAGSAFMFHLTNTMFKSSIPGMDDVLQQNPELMKQFAEAAVGSINKPQPTQPANPLAAMMGGGGGGGGNPLAAMMGGGGGGGGNPLAAMMGLGGNSSSTPERTSSPARSDMSGPDGLDDLISKMKLEPDKIPDLDNISLMSGDSDKKSGGGITLNL